MGRTGTSSESEEESNSRHDRFKSERFQEQTSTGFNPREERNKYTSSDRYNSGRHRARSPVRPQRYREESSLSSYRSESRSNHERKDRYKEHRTKSSKSERSDRTTYNKRCLGVSESDKSSVGKGSKSKLSSLLKNFDKQLEEKRNNLETSCEIGPALPPRLRQDVEGSAKYCEEQSQVDEEMAAPIIPPHIKNSEEKIKSNPTVNDIGEVFLPNLELNVHNGSSEENIDSKAVSNEGPLVPAHFQDQNTCKSDSTNGNIDVPKPEGTSSNVIEAIAEHGPVLPPKSEPDVYGPALPPKVETDSYGPALPPHLQQDVVKGPSLPSGEVLQEESEDEDTLGPLPEGVMNMTQHQLQQRAIQIKRKLEEEKNVSTSDVKRREEWMLELPPEKASNLGLGPRSFRMREAPDMSNRSSWTDTPADKLRKEEQALRGEAEPVNTEEVSRLSFLKEREEAMEKMAQKSREDDRPHSLLELHQKKLKKKKKKEEKEGKKKERRPFDRNIDLQVNRFDDAQKKAIFKKAQLLDTRFSTGESKFL